MTSAGELKVRHLDTSALAKLVLTERESTALRDLLRDGQDQVTALVLGPALGSLVTYDARMAEAATAVGIPVEAPS